MTVGSSPLAQGEPLELHRGERVGKYELLAQLTVGGMSEVFVAFTSGPGGFRKHVVLKRILPEVRSQEHFVQMFMDEARITAGLNHANIGQVFDLGEDDEGALFLSMEFIPGQNLNQIYRAALKRGMRGLPVGLSCAVVRDVCRALHYAHTFTDAGGQLSPVIHRDVAQKNIMVTYDGVTKLVDFGIAKARSSMGRTQVGTVKGTTGYMSPEQVRGDELDGRSDVFCAGVVLYELLTGQRLFAGPTEYDEMVACLQAPIVPPQELVPSAVSRQLNDLVMKALERDRDRRFLTARDMARALEVAVGGTLYDAEQSAGLMRQLFEEKMGATRALIDSAGESEASTGVRRALRLLREDANSDFPAGLPPQAPAAPAFAPTPRSEAPTDDDATGLEIPRVPAPPVPPPRPPAPVRASTQLTQPRRMSVEIPQARTSGSKGPKAPEVDRRAPSRTGGKRPETEARVPERRAASSSARPPTSTPPPRPREAHASSAMEEEDTNPGRVLEGAAAPREPLQILGMSLGLPLLLGLALGGALLLALLLFALFGSGGAGGEAGDAQRLPTFQGRNAPGPQ